MHQVQAEEKIPVLIADDEALARNGLMKRLEAYSQLDVISVCSNGEQALQEIISVKPKAIFLDIEMPKLTGLQVLERIKQQSFEAPYCIFTTAYQNFAVKAFEYSVCDYLLKPFNEERLACSIGKLFDSINSESARNQTDELQTLLKRKSGKTLNSFMDGLRESNNCQLSALHNTIAVKEGTEWIRIKLQDIEWIESAGNFTCIHAGSKQHIIRKTMNQFEVELNPEIFVRVGRSAIININKIVRITPNSNGEFYLFTAKGQSIKLGRKYRFKLQHLLQNQVKN